MSDRVRSVPSRRSGFAFLTWTTGLAASAMLLTAPEAAQAQSRRADATANRLTLGEETPGSLSNARRTEDGRSYVPFVVNLAAGANVQIDMGSEDFDPYLDISRVGREGGLLAEDDDGGMGLDARLRFTAREAGDYLIRAQAVDSTSGRFTIAVRERAPILPPTPVAAAYGFSGEGRFDEATPQLGEKYPYALYHFRGEAGDRVLIDMKSDDFDSQLVMRPLVGQGREVRDDDGGAGLNARILTTLEAAGDYEVSAMSVSREGAYTLSIRKLPARFSASEPAPLVIGREIRGALSFEDAVVAQNSSGDGAQLQFYKLFVVEGRAGQTLVVNLKSDAFDPMMEAGVMSPVGFAVATSNDDANGLNSELVLTFAEPGRLFIRASSTGESDGGEFTISAIERAR